MRIGIDARLWNQTGVGRYIRNLIIGLQKIDEKNNYVLFVGSNDYEDAKKEIISNRWQIVRANVKWHSLKEQFELPRIFNKENLDLLHFPYFSVPVFYNKPFVLTIHDLIIHHYPTGKASTLFPLLYYLKFYSYKYIIYNAAQKAKRIITPSISTKEEVMDHLGINDNKISVTYEAADTNINNQSAKSKFQKPGDYFLYVGNAYPHKNLDKLVEVFADFHKDFKEAKLILVGSKDFFYLRLMKKIKNLKMEDMIILKSNVSDSELSYLYKNAIALVSPSLMEGFGLPVLEAMANKCLVLCSNIPAFKEIARGNAVYFNPQEKKDILDKLIYVYKKQKNAELENLIKNGYDLSRRFSWEKMARETLKVYESCFSL